MLVTYVITKQVENTFLQIACIGSTIENDKKSVLQICQEMEDYMCTDTCVCMYTGTETVQKILELSR